jgi:hypothetical protein
VPPAPPVPPGIPPPPSGMLGMPSMQPPAQNPNLYYSQPQNPQLQGAYQGTVPANNGYGNVPQSSTPQPGLAPAAPLAGLPPNILALLQSAQQRPQHPPGPGQPPYGMPPQMMNTPPPPPPGASAAANAQYQSLMAYLAS